MFFCDHWVILQNPQSVTILMKGPNKHSLEQIKDAIRDGLRAINNAIEDKAVIPGAIAILQTSAEQLFNGVFIF